MEEKENSFLSTDSLNPETSAKTLDSSNVSLNKCKKIKNISSIFSKHNNLKLEINYKEKKNWKKKHKYVEAKQHAIKKSKNNNEAIS